MQINLTSTAQTLDDFFKSLKILRDEKVLINKKDFTCQIGEWLVEMLFEGKRATSGIQKGWDVIVDGRHIQVKAHAKAEGNKNRWSAVEKESTERIDELIIVVFSFDYKLKELFRIPWKHAYPLIKLRGKKNPRNEINWSSIKEFKIENDALPNQQIVSLFK